MSKFLIVLFRNKNKRKIIKKFQKINNAESFFSKLLQESNNVIFSTEVENAKPVSFELAILQKDSKKQTPTYMKDVFGRNVKIELESSEYDILKISPYNVSDTIFDITKKKKISVDYFLSNYLPKIGIKVVSILNNKIIVQNEEKIRLFSLKSEVEAERFISCISDYFFKIKRGDTIFVKDSSSPQRKYLLDLLQKNGFDKKILYRKYTTHPQSAKK